MRDDLNRHPFLISPKRWPIYKGISHPILRIGFEREGFVNGADRDTDRSYRCGIGFGGDTEKEGKKNDQGNHRQDHQREQDKFFFHFCASQTNAPARDRGKHQVASSGILLSPLPPATSHDATGSPPSHQDHYTTRTAYAKDRASRGPVFL